ncbi:hypothetical protein HDV04_005277 [Boothiomyces sp. JEL0838]|nr:hypothetical protein HDV04_005277 [Boothiomyces sp. JEL0838]
MEFSTFCANALVIDNNAWHSFLTGLTVQQAIERLRKATGNDHAKTAQIIAVVTTQYRNFEMLEAFLQHPKTISTQLIFPINARTRSKLIQSYYKMEPRVVRELLGKKLTHRVRKELDDISTLTGIPILGCRRMFDNLKRITKLNYANLVGSLFYEYFVASPETALEELDPAIAEDSRHLKTLFNHKDNLEKFRQIITDRLTNLNQPATAEKAANMTTFKIIFRNMWSIGTSLTNNKEMRDLYFILVDRIVDPFLTYGWTYQDVDIFFSAIIGILQEEKANSLCPSMSSRNRKTFIKLCSIIKFASTRLFKPNGATYTLAETIYHRKTCMSEKHLKFHQLDLPIHSTVEITPSSPSVKARRKFLDGMISDNGCLPTATKNPNKKEVLIDVKNAAKEVDKLIWFQKNPHMRTFDQIKQNGSFDIEMFRTTPKKNMQKEKEKFQERLESNAVTVKRKEQKIPEPEINEITMLEDEIAERRQWLADMVALGRGDAYKRQIQTEIMLRVSKLETLKKTK